LKFSGLKRIVLTKGSRSGIWAFARSTVKQGETVTWINKDPFPHTATAPGVFDSRDIPPNRS